MSVQFGRWSFGAPPLTEEDLDRIDSMLVPYGPDERVIAAEGGVQILVRTFDSTRDASGGLHRTASGLVVSWDGRLDNREDILILGKDLSSTSTDGELAARACEHWGTEAFRRLVGDWALSVWDSRDQNLLLAKDPIGTRHLYYSVEGTHISWCTLLDPLVFLSPKPVSLSMEYIAGWLSFLPASHLSPYEGIHSVEPSHFVRLTRQGGQARRYWDFDPNKRVRHDSDAEYEDHFRTLMAEAVRRRLRSARPVLAELSGGMDSSSIVCMADRLIEGGNSSASVDTISYYNNAEPHWDERPFFSLVEQKRGRQGHHFDLTSNLTLLLKDSNQRFRSTPAALSRWPEGSSPLARCLIGGGYRVVLSGIGGDEVLGGVPTPFPELADCLAIGNLRGFMRQAIAWALVKRKPLFKLLGGTLQPFLPLGFTNGEIRIPVWVCARFARKHRHALGGYPTRLRFFGARPSFQENQNALEVLRRQIGSLPLPSVPPYERRYPLLDRDLLEFLYAIPREQIVRPAQRRSLMRRSLVGIVPDELLNRKRKAFVSREFALTISREWPELLRVIDKMAMASLGMIDPKRLEEALEMTRDGRDTPRTAIARTFQIEYWLRHVQGELALRQSDAMQMADRLVQNES